MTREVVISPTGQSATVSGAYHTTQIVGLDDARSWVEFYRRLSQGKSGHFYEAPLKAFQQALAGMKAAQAGAGAQ